MQTENQRYDFEKFDRLGSRSRSALSDGTAILLLSIPLALGLGILIGHAFPAEFAWFIPR